MNLIKKLGGYERAKGIRDINIQEFDGDASGVTIHYMGDSFIQEDLVLALLEHRRENNIFEVGDLVVRKNKKSKPLIWEVVGYSNVFKDSAICDNENELLNHFSFKDIRHATPEEIKAGHRL